MSNYTYPDQPAEYYREQIKRSQKANNRITDDPDWEMADSGVTLQCNDLSVMKYELLAQLAENGGMSDFPALADLDGNILNAKIIPTHYGSVWAFLDDQGNITGQFVGAHKTDKYYGRKGYQIVSVSRKACVTMIPNGSGLAGLYGAYYAVVEDRRGTWSQKKES